MSKVIRVTADGGHVEIKATPIVVEETPVVAAVEEPKKPRKPKGE